MVPGLPLVLDQVTIRLDGRILVSISARVAPGEVLTVMGPSGSGKSTLIAYIAGFLDPVFEASGRVLSGDTDLTTLAAEDRRAGILFQDPLLFPHLDVAGNIAIAIPQAVGRKPERRALAEAALEKAGLTGFEQRDPDTLSGGQKARAALLRVMMSQPRLLLLDEPFSKLDADLKAQMRDLVFERARAAGLPVILVTHDRADADAAGGPVHVIGTVA